MNFACGSLLRINMLINSWSTCWFSDNSTSWSTTDQLCYPELINMGRQSWSTVDQHVHFEIQLVDQQLIIFGDQSWSTQVVKGDQQLSNFGSSNQLVTQQLSNKLNVGGESYSTVVQHVDFEEFNLLINCWSTSLVSHE